MNKKDIKNLQDKFRNLKEEIDTLHMKIAYLQLKENKNNKRPFFYKAELRTGGTVIFNFDELSQIVEDSKYDENNQPIEDAKIYKIILKNDSVSYVTPETFFDIKDRL